MESVSIWNWQSHICTQHHFSWSLRSHTCQYSHSSHFLKLMDQYPSQPCQTSQAVSPSIWSTQPWSLCPLCWLVCAWTPDWNVRCQSFAFSFPVHQDSKVLTILVCHPQLLSSPISWNLISFWGTVQSIALISLYPSQTCCLMVASCCTQRWKQSHWNHHKLSCFSHPCFPEDHQWSLCAFSFTWKVITWRWSQYLLSLSAQAMSVSTSCCGSLWSSLSHHHLVSALHIHQSVSHLSQTQSWSCQLSQLRDFLMINTSVDMPPVFSALSISDHASYWPLPLLSLHDLLAGSEQHPHSSDIDHQFDGAPLLIWSSCLYGIGGAKRRNQRRNQRHSTPCCRSTDFFGGVTAHVVCHQ